MAGAREDVGSNAAWQANFKKMFEDAQNTANAFQNQAVEAASRSRVQFDQLQQLSLVALTNAVETANMVGKQAVAHRDLAIDREWNVNETDALAVKLVEAVQDED